jgi:hypothetical protein
MTASPSTGTHPPAAPTPLWKSYLAFLGPMIFSNFLQSVSGTVNNIYLGQMLGVKAMAAVSAFFPVLFFLIAFMIGLGSGASVLIGQAWGARELDRVKAIAGTTLMTGLIAGLAVAVFGGSFADMMLVALGTPADILPGATAYARIMLIAAPGVFTFILVTSMLRGVGDTRTPLLTLLISTAVGLLLTPALIRGWLGLPELGVTSGAWAAVASYLIALGWTARHLLRQHHALAPDAAFRSHLRIDRALLAKVLGQLVPRHGAQVHLVGPVHQAQGAAPGPQGGQRRVGRQAHGAKDLHGAVHHALLQARGHHLDGGDLGTHLPGICPIGDAPWSSSQAACSTSRRAWSISMRDSAIHSCTLACSASGLPKACAPARARWPVAGPARTGRWCACSGAPAPAPGAPAPWQSRRPSRPAAGRRARARCAAISQCPSGAWWCSTRMLRTICTPGASTGTSTMLWRWWLSGSHPHRRCGTAR